jgi:phenylpropionate dioxygenase-like ring-hydroxylating dioxygenase large terminal subunit
MNVYAGKLETRDDPLVLDTDPVPAKYYYDADWYELERKAVWMRSWLNVGHVCELPEPGSFIRRELEFAKASVLIVRGKDGQIRAFHNVCTHRGTQLTDEPCGKKNTFSCPYHMWTFGTDGALLSAPDFERFYTTKEENSLKPVAVDVCAGLIFLCFDPQEDLLTFLGSMAPMLEQLPLARATTYQEYHYDIDANWKLTYDNFQENYHLRFVHPRTAGAGGFGGDNPFGYPSHFTLNGIHRTQTIWTHPDPQVPEVLRTMFMRGMPRLMADGLMDSALSREYVALFPNFFLLCNPGQHFLHTVLPIGPEKSRGVIRLYWVGNDETASTRYFREASMQTARDVHSEDVDIIRAGQRGISSGAISHINFQEKEVLCRHLIRVVEEKVEAYRAEQA